MEKAKKKCLNCGAEEKQWKLGFNRSGTQRYVCGCCGRKYTPEPKRNRYSEEERKEAIKMYYSGASGRQVGSYFGFSKANVYNWIKKVKKNGESV